MSENTIKLNLSALKVPPKQETLENHSPQVQEWTISHATENATNQKTSPKKESEKKSNSPPVEIQEGKKSMISLESLWIGSPTSWKETPQEEKSSLNTSDWAHVEKENPLHQEIKENNENTISSSLSETLTQEIQNIPETPILQDENTWTQAEIKKEENSPDVLQDATLQDIKIQETHLEEEKLDSPQKKKFWIKFPAFLSKKKQKIGEDSKTSETQEMIVKKDDSQPKEIHFNNYESSFKKSSNNILKRIQNFKYAPKTRVGLLISLVSITVIFIASLMVLFPEKHSLAIYKASILSITGNSQEDPDLPDSSNIPEQLPPPKKPENVEEDTEEFPDWSGTWNTLESEEQENIRKRNEKIKEEILRNHLLKKYGKD